MVTKAERKAKEATERQAAQLDPETISAPTGKEHHSADMTEDNKAAAVATGKGIAEGWLKKGEVVATIEAMGNGYIDLAYAQETTRGAAIVVMLRAYADTPSIIEQLPEIMKRRIRQVYGFPAGKVSQWKDLIQVKAYNSKTTNHVTPVRLVVDWILREGKDAIPLAIQLFEGDGTFAEKVAALPRKDDGNMLYFPKSKKGADQNRSDSDDDDIIEVEKEKPVDKSASSADNSSKVGSGKPVTDAMASIGLFSAQAHFTDILQKVAFELKSREWPEHKKECCDLAEKVQKALGEFDAETEKQPVASQQQTA